MPRISNHPERVFSCTFERCTSIFTRKSDRERHERHHLPYAARPFKCEFENCAFRANQKSGIKVHQNSVHFGKRLPCRDPACNRDFSDPSTLSRHMSKCHNASARKRKVAPWRGLINTFSATTSYTHPAEGSEAPAAVAATTSRAPFNPSLQKRDSGVNETANAEGRSREVTSQNPTLHTSPVGRQEGFGNPSLLDSLLRITPSPTSSPILQPADPFQLNWQFQYPYYSSDSSMNFPSCSNTLFPGFSLPEPTVTMHSAFQMGAGTPVDRYFSPLLEIPMDQRFVGQSSRDATFFVAPNANLPGASRMPPPLINYGATRSDPFRETHQSWQADPFVFDFGYGAPQPTEYYPRFSQLNSLSSL